MADPKDTRNWLKLNFLADHACILLRALFKKTWKETFNHEWDTTQASVILDRQNLKIKKNQRQMIETGDIAKWDVTLLIVLFTTPGLLSVKSDQTANVKKISNIRNELMHHPTKFVPKQQFDVWWNEIQQTLVNFGASESELEQLKQQNRKGGVEFLPEDEMSEQNNAESLQLKEKGNVSFKNGDFSEAIRLYTEAVCLSGLPGIQRATLHANRCVSFLKIHEKILGKNDVKGVNLEHAEADAKKAIELSPDWCKGYFRLGQVHMAMGKFSKAENSLNKALEKEPQNKQILNALSNARMKKGQKERMDYLDPRTCPKSTSEYIQEVNRKMDSNIKSDAIKNFLAVKTDNPETKSVQDCYVGHCYKRGTDGYPQDDRLAAEHYRKAFKRGSAEGMLNLGCMTLGGEGVEQDFKAGIKLLKKAASQSPTNQHNAVNFGVAESEHALGLCYEEGVGVTKNLHKAMHWYQRASIHGCSTASNNLGVLYESGKIDGKPDLVKAEQFYRTAATSGANPANFAMFNLAKLLALKGDSKRALVWCRRSKEHGNMNPRVDKVMEELEKEIDGLTKQSQNIFFSSEAPQLATSVTKGKIAERIMATCNMPPTNLDNAKVRFTREELIKCCDISEYGQHLWSAKKHCLVALDILNKYDLEETLPMEDCEKFIAHFSAGAQIEFMVFELSPQLRRSAISTIEQLLTQKTTCDEDVRVCYVSLQDTYSAKPTIAFLNNCIQKYPQNIFFHKMRVKLNAFLGHYEDGVLNVNTALRLCPIDWDCLFSRAQLMHHTGRVFPPQASIDAYKLFLELAPKDHWKVPEAYYGIAHLIIFEAEMRNMQIVNASSMLEALEVFTKVTTYYELGMAAEKQQLCFFLPYVSSTKIKVEDFFAEVTGMFESSVGVNPKNPESHDLPIKLSDPYRITKITQHRLGIDGNHRMNLWIAKNCAHELKITIQPPRQQLSPESLANLKTINLEDMDPTKDFIYKGCVLDATVIDEVDFTGSSISLVIEDRNGHAERCFIYNCPVMADVAKSKKEFGPGCQMSIINPYMRMAMDGKPAIRVNDPNSIIRKGFEKNMCRYCCKANATLPCAKCKIALYCNKKCQKLDLEKMQHNLICH